MIIPLIAFVVILILFLICMLMVINTDYNEEWTVTAAFLFIVTFFAGLVLINTSIQWQKAKVNATLINRLCNSNHTPEELFYNKEFVFNYQKSKGCGTDER